MIINKYELLTEYLKNLESVVVAFSGGTDSSLLAFAASQALKQNSVALTIKTPYIANWEFQEAIEFTKLFNIKHLIVELPMLTSIENNPDNRCYTCKKSLFGKISETAQSLGFKYVIDGTNIDDFGDYRPGLQALRELKVISPFVECRITKKEIREISQYLNLPTWDKPAYACLLTRLPYNQPVNLDDLKIIEQAEKFLMDLGFKANRVRLHNKLARIEVPEAERFILLNHSEKIAQYFKSIDISYITLDLLGYRMGSFNETIKKNN